MTSPLTLIGIVISSTREARFGEKHGVWIHEIAKQRKDLTIELINLRDHSQLFFDEPQSPTSPDIKSLKGQRWADRLAPIDGLIVVTPEYDQGTSDELKIAFDSAGQKLSRKPVGFVGYGGTGRVIEQLQLVAIELQMAPLSNAVHIDIAEFIGIWQQGKNFNDYPHLAQAATKLLDDIVWWAQALKKPRAKI
ncbi:NADPH-dependent FMN reductase [Pseudomonas sp. GL-B-26]|uniref:NADPH-dependent FMN reductase n=1 Tax=Pseudomonas sp. GL-B-26 TaxID=2832394 RepID=UPI001CBB1757|nr:NAD(P)H-dependent oxidoreductase [Pseudomonas sp. GL-B-26]